MKIKTVVSLLSALVLFATSCKKSDLILTPLSASSTDDMYKETAAEVQTPVTYDIDANIGGYLEALPAHYGDHPFKHYPLIIFLHGQGEMGSGSASALPVVADNSIPALIANKTFPENFTVNGNTLQFIVISPQFKGWPQPSDVNDAISYAISKYRIDSSRIYVAGLSMGGGGTWDVAWNYGNRIAAIVPMAGASWPTTEKAQNIATANIAVWAFHNNNDPTVPYWYSQDYVQYINACKPLTPAKLTTFNAAEHDCWTQASDPDYRENGQNIYEWMLSYRKLTAKSKH